MDPWIIISSVIAYLLGSISFARIVSHFADSKVNLDEVEMEIPGADEPYRLKTIGANTASMKLGPRLGCTIGILDILKVFLPTLVIRLLFPGQYYFLAAAVAGFIGHCWPIYYHFKGGGGISAFYGGLFAIDPIGALAVSIGSLLIGMVLLKELLFAYTGGVILIIPWLWFTTHNPYYLAYAVAINVLFVLAMIPELKQFVEMRRKYGKADMKASMDTFPMGKSMLKMMNKLNRKSSS